MMVSHPLDAPERVCSCGHPVSAHWSETETVRFMGLFNPALTGKVETHTRTVCNHIEGDEYSGEPCGALRHSW